MASIEIRDEVVIVVSRGTVATVIAQRSRWRTWWPRSRATVVVDHGAEGMRWALTGEMVGSTQITLVDEADGVRVRYAMSVDPTVPGSATVARALPDSPYGRRELVDLRRRQETAWKQVMWALKDELEGGGRGRAG